jgi:hypothetical protein
MFKGASGLRCQVITRRAIVVGEPLPMEEECNASAQASAAVCNQLSNGSWLLHTTSRIRQNQSGALDLHRLMFDMRYGKFWSARRYIDQ